MLSFTPEVESVLRWFEATHVLEVSGFGAARYRRIGLPGPGNVGEQEAWLMAALDFVRRISDDTLRPDEPKKGTDE